MLKLLTLSRFFILIFSLNLILSSIPGYIVAQNAPDCSQVQPNDKSSECNRQANIQAFIKKRVQQSKKQTKKQMEIGRQIKNFINPKESLETTAAQPDEASEEPEPLENVQKTKTIQQLVNERRRQDDQALFRRIVEASKSRNVSNKGRKGRRTYGRAIVPYRRP